MKLGAFIKKGREGFSIKAGGKFRSG